MTPISDFTIARLTRLSLRVSETDFVDGEWHHVALVAAGNNVKLYIDGVLDAAFTDFTHPDVAFGGDRVGLGALLRTGANFASTRLMDEVAIFNRALTEQEVSHLASGVSPTVIPEPASLGLIAAGIALAANRRRRGAIA